MSENTFLGLQPYSEEDAYRFKGRTEESQELFRLIVRNDFTVCYAESGEGKTSLLNAGVFPLLRKNMYFPIAITFTSDDFEVTPDNFSTIIDRCINDRITEFNEKNNGVNVEYKLCSTDFQGLDSQTELQHELSKYSWWKLRNYRPQAMGLTFTPVFIFDQFEEVFNMPGSIVWTKKFFDWLEDVSSDSCPDDIAKKVRETIGTNAAFPAIKEEKGFKAVFSLRKEFIGELDYWGMQKCFIPSLKDNRYCLKALTYEGAKKVMTQQQRFDENKVEQVLSYFVGQYSREPERTIEEHLPVIQALLLSVVCDSWEKDMDVFAELSTAEIGQSLNMVLERFFDQAIDVIVQELSEEDPGTQSDQCRYDLDTAVFALVDGNGKRVRTKTTSTSLTQVDFDAKYKQALSRHRIIKVTKVDGEDYVEIVHDCLCPIVAGKKNARLAAEAKMREEQLLREQSRKLKRRMTILGLSVIAVIALGAIFFSLQRDNLKQREATEAYKLQRDSIQDLQYIVENQKEELRRDSAMLASHLSQILDDSIMLVEKNNSLQLQIAINQQKDKTIERLEAFSRLNVSQNVAGKLSERISPNLRKYATSLSVSGQLNGTDIALLREMIIEGNLRHLDLKYAKIVKGGRFFFYEKDFNKLMESIIEADNDLGDYIFFDCSRLLSIILPNSVTSIGSHAFRGCSSLTSIIIPNSVTSIGDWGFSGCSSLTSITIPASVTSIEDYAFLGCSGLTSITISNSVTSIGESTFSSCSRLTSITIPESVTTIESGAFHGCESLTSITIPNSVTSIGERAFSGCSRLTSITIPESVTTIRRGTFEFCSSLTSITIPQSVETIQERAFLWCKNLTSITIPESVTTIEPKAFSDCFFLKKLFKNNSTLTDIRSWGATLCDEETQDGLLISDKTVVGHRPWMPSIVIIPSSVTSIGYGAFSYCDSLTSITIPNSVTSIGNKAFLNCFCLTSITIPTSVTSIEDYAFENCSSLTSVTIQEGVKSIGEGAFSSCSSLTSVTIPEGVTSIGNYAFMSCISLTSITIPQSVARIGLAIFENCSSLTYITLPNSVTINCMPK